MRSPWLSREYEKSKDVVVQKIKDGYLLKNKKNNSEFLLDEKLYNKYQNNEMNEIEWEML